MKLKRFFKLGILALIAFPAVLLAYVHEDYAPYTEPEETTGGELERFIVAGNQFSSTVVEPAQGFSGIVFDSPAPLNLASPEIQMPDENGKIEYAGDSTLTIDTDTVAGSYMSDEYHRENYEEFNAIKLAYSLGVNEKIILYNADIYYMEVASSDRIGALDQSSGVWVMIPKTRSVALEVVTNGDGTPPGNIAILAFGTYTLPDMTLTDLDRTEGFEFINDQTEKKLWVLRDNPGLQDISVLEYEDSTVLEAEKILSTIGGEKIWDGQEWNSIKFPWKPEGNPGEEYTPDVMWDAIYPGRNINALMAFVYTDGYIPNKLLVDGNLNPASANYEETPRGENDSRQFVLLSDWLAYKLEVAMGWTTYKPQEVSDDICTTLGDCAFSPEYGAYEELLYPSVKTSNFEAQEFTLNNPVESGTIIFKTPPVSGGNDPGMLGVPLVALYNTASVGADNVSNLMVLEYHDSDIDTFDGDRSSVVTPLIINDAGVIYNTYTSIYGRNTSEEIDWNNDNEVILEWGNGRIRVFINGVPIQSAYYSGKITINKIFIGGVPENDLFSEFTETPPEFSDVRVYTTERDISYQVNYGNETYSFDRDRYTNFPNGIPVHGALKLGSMSCSDSGQKLSFSSNESTYLSLDVSACNVTLTLDNGGTYEGTISSEGDAEFIWFFNALNGQTDLRLYVNGELVVANNSDYGIHAPYIGTIFRSHMITTTAGAYELWQKFVYATDLIVEEPSGISGYKLYVSSNKDEVDTRSVTPKIVSLEVLQRYFQPEIEITDLTPDTLYFAGMTSYYRHGESNISNIVSFSPGVREDITPPIPRAAASYDKTELSESDTSLCLNAKRKNTLLFDTAFADSGVEDNEITVESNIFNVTLGENLMLDASLSTDNSDASSSTDYKKYSWSIGSDTNFDTSENPMHVYMYPGTYTISLEAQDELGAKGYAYQKVIVQTPANMVPIVGIEVGTDLSMTPLSTPTVAPGETVYFEGSALDYYGDNGFYNWAYVWDFGDGIQEDNTETAKNAVLPASGDELVKVPIPHTYTEPGTYTASLTVIDDDLNEGVYQYTIIVADISLSHESIEITSGGTPFTLGVTGGRPPYMIQNDATSKTMGTPGHITLPLSAGELLVTDAIGNQKTIEITETELPTAANVPPNPSIDLETATGTAPLTVYPTISGNPDEDGYISAFSWNFGDGVPWIMKINLPSTDSPGFLHDDPDMTTGNFEAMGTFPGMLTVADSNGNTQKQNILINVHPNSVALTTDTGIVAGKTTIGASSIDNNISIEKTLATGQTIQLATMDTDEKGGFIYVPKTSPQLITGGITINDGENTAIIINSTYGVHLLESTTITPAFKDGNLTYILSMSEGEVTLTQVSDKNQDVNIVTGMPFDVVPGLYVILDAGLLLDEDGQTFIAAATGTPLVSWSRGEQLTLLRDADLQAHIIRVTNGIFSKDYLGTEVIMDGKTVARVVSIPNFAEGNQVYVNQPITNNEGWYFAYDAESPVMVETFAGDLFSVNPGDKLHVIVQDKNAKSIQLDGEIEVTEDILLNDRPIVGVTTNDYQEILDFTQKDYHINDPAPIVFGSGAPGKTVTVKTPTGEQEAIINNLGSWRYNLALSEASTFVEFYHDGARTGSINFILDTDRPAAPYLTAWRGLTLEGQTESFATVGILIGEDTTVLETDKQGAFTITVPYGTQSVTLVAIDRAGNISEKALFTPQTDLTANRTLVDILWSKTTISIIIFVIAILSLWWVRKQK